MYKWLLVFLVVACFKNYKSISGFQNPSALCLSSQEGFYFIANQGASLEQNLVDGYISFVHESRTIAEKYFIRDLKNPKSIASIGNFLYVLDGDRDLSIYNTRTRRLVKKTKLPLKAKKLVIQDNNKIYFLSNFGSIYYLDLDSFAVERVPLPENMEVESFFYHKTQKVLYFSDGQGVYRYHFFSSIDKSLQKIIDLPTNHFYPKNNSLFFYNKEEQNFKIHYYKYDNKEKKRFTTIKDVPKKNNISDILFTFIGRKKYLLVLYKNNNNLFFIKSL